MEAGNCGKPGNAAAMAKGPKKIFDVPTNRPLFSETAATEFRKRDCESPGPVIQRVESVLRPSNCLAIWPWWTREREIFTQTPKADYYVDVLLSLEPITKGGGYIYYIYSGQGTGIVGCSPRPRAGMRCAF